MRPSMNPRRVYSFMNSSEVSFPKPYEPSGVAIVEEVMISGYMIDWYQASISLSSRRKSAYKGPAIHG